MKPFLLLTVLLGLAGGVALWAAPRKAPGPCEPYAEVCRHCSDCSACKHCAKDGGKCSVCWKKR